MIVSGVDVYGKWGSLELFCHMDVVFQPSVALQSAAPPHPPPPHHTHTHTHTHLPHTHKHTFATHTRTHTHAKLLNE